MKKINENGFGAVGIFALVVIIGLISAVGWLVYDRQKDKDANTTTQISNQTSSQEQKQPTEKDETLNWVTFSPNSKLYSINLADGWVMQHQNDECDCLLTKSLTYTRGTPAVIETTSGGRDGGSGFFIAVDNEDKSSQRFNSAWKMTGTLKIANLEATKYYYEQTTEPEGIGLPKGGKEYAYYIPKDNQYIYISYSVYADQENQLELVEKTIKTLK